MSVVVKKSKLVTLCFSKWPTFRVGGGTFRDFQLADDESCRGKRSLGLLRPSVLYSYLEASSRDLTPLPLLPLDKSCFLFLLLFCFISETLAGPDHEEEEPYRNQRVYKEQSSLDQLLINPPPSYSPTMASVPLALSSRISPSSEISSEPSPNVPLHPFFLWSQQGGR